MRHAHYWKVAGAKSAPSEIVVFDCETWHGDRAAEDGGEWHTLRLGCALAYRLEHGKRTRIQRLTFRTKEAFWNLVESRLSPHRPVWVFAHNAAYDLGIVDGWAYIGLPDVEVKKAAVTGSLLYITSVRDGCKLVFGDTLNYWKCSLKELGKSVGLAKMEMPDQSAPDHDWEAYCRNDVEVTALGVDALIHFQRQHMLGPWQPSISGLAFSAYRSCFMKDKILVHDDRKCLELERGCYYGGLVETPFVGTVGESPIYELDVCSMYPSVCMNDLPMVKKGYTERVGVEWIKRMSDKYHIAAEVTVDTSDYPYPIALKSGTYYPLGRYRTCLAHPELMHALRSGHIKWVHRAAWYTHGPIFAEYMTFFGRKKVEYSKPETKAFRTLCKYYLNSLYGKTGQMSPKWCEWGPEAMELLEGQYGLKPGTLVDGHLIPPDLYEVEEDYRFREINEPIPVRNYYGVTEIKVGEHESRDSVPIIAATVTSYARMLLRSYHRIAGEGNWYYSDTDSIWTNVTGRQRLIDAGCVQEDTLGKLSQAGEHEWLRVYGPKDYQTPKVLRLKGIRHPDKPNTKGGWTQLHFPSAAAQIRLGRGEGVFVASVDKKLKRQITKSVLLPCGKTRPLKFPEENPDLLKGRKCRGES